jgi:hypothetical protein
MTRLLPALAAFTVAALFCGAPVAASAQNAYEHAIAQPDPGGVVVALTIRFPAGSALDPEGEEGTAFILGRVLEEEANLRLAPLRSRIEVGVGRHEFLVTLLSPASSWAEALRVLEGILDDGSLSESTASRIRDRQAERALFELGAPVRAFEVERARLVLGVSTPGARPIDGTRESMLRIPDDGPLRFRARHLDRAQATIAVVGPVSESDLERALGPGVRHTSPTAPPTRAAVPAARAAVPTPPVADTGVVEVPARQAAPLPPAPLTRLRTGSAGALGIGSGPAAWSTGSRDILDRDLTSTWIAIAWPFPEGTSEVLLDFLGHILLGSVVQSPPEPGLFGIEVSIDFRDASPLLVVSAAVDPRTTLAWEERILQGMARMADSPPEGAFFELGRRRFRNTRLLATAGAADRSRWIARTLGTSRPLPDEELQIWALSRTLLSSASEATAPPRILLMGPRAMIEGSRR